MDTIIRFLMTLLRWMLIGALLIIGLALSGALILVLTLYILWQKIRGKPIQFQKFQRSFQTFHKSTAPRKRYTDVEDATFHPSTTQNNPTKHLD